MAERSRTLFWAIYGLWRSLKARHSDPSVSKVPKALQEAEARTLRQDYPGASGAGRGVSSWECDEQRRQPELT